MFMDLPTCTQTLTERVGDDSGLNASLKFDCGSDGIVFIDGKATPNTVDNTDREAECTVTITLENLAAMLTGDLEPVTGFMTGRFTVAGDMSVAMRLNRVV
jgi:putative sterol carrier protein